MESKEVFMDLDQLLPDGLQPRKIFDDKDIEDFARDINTNGLHEGIDINPLLDGRETRYTIIDGERRYRAIQLIDGYGQVRCNLYAYKSQKEIDDHRASKEFHKTKWPPVNRAEFLEYYMGAHKLRKQDLARRFSKAHTTIGRWLAPAKHKDILSALRGDRIGFSQAVVLSQIDSAETRENALREVAVSKGDKKTTLEEVVSKIELLVQNSKGQIKTSSKTPEEKITKTPEEDALTVNDGEGETTTEEAVEKDDDSGRKSLQPSSPETSSIIGQDFERGGEKGIEESISDPSITSQPQSPLPEGGTDSQTPDIDPPLETKKKEPQVCAKVSNMEEMLQKLVQKPPKTFLATFKTTSHKGNFKNRVEGIHLWSGELSDLMESDLNGKSLFICEVKRKRKALMDILARPKHSIIKSEREKFDDLMDELKTKIEQDAKRGG